MNTRRLNSQRVIKVVYVYTVAYKYIECIQHHKKIYRID